MSGKNITLTAHCIVKNEENFIKFSIESVINFVDILIVFDTGSTDSTVDIVKELSVKYHGKIIFEEKGPQDKKNHTNLRQEMLERTNTDWFMMLDGDEVWTDRGMQEAIRKMNSGEAAWLVSPYYLCVGDIRHKYYKNSYNEFYKKNSWFFTPRFIKNIEGLKWKGDYESDTLYKNNSEPLYTSDNIVFLENSFWHLTHLKRSSRDDDTFTSGIDKTRLSKRRLTYFLIGRKINEKLPEVFLKNDYLKMSWLRSFINFLGLFVFNPRLIYRKILELF